LEHLVFGALAPAAGAAGEVVDSPLPPPAAADFALNFFYVLLAIFIHGYATRRPFGGRKSWPNLFNEASVNTFG
jgi:hypothetical protein